MNILITGADGFIGKNLRCQLAVLPDMTVLSFCRSDSIDTLRNYLGKADVVVHLAGVNRPEEDSEFIRGNTDFTKTLCDLATTDRAIPIIFSSSTQAGNESPYGQSKQAAEKVLAAYAENTGADVIIYRLPNVMGKWCLPNYNSVVATFCFNLANDLPITINDENTVLNLVYIDDLVKDLLAVIPEVGKGGGIPAFRDVAPVYEVSLGELANILTGFRDSRQNLQIDNVGTGFKRALYATYISYLDKSAFCYPLSGHSDERGIFVEFLKTPASGQMSFFTAKPGISRGQHYHHTKTEKFLVVQGNARFRFRQLLSGSYHEICVAANEYTVVESIPGWTHDVTNMGDDELIVLLWSSEVFDVDRPDTTAKEIDSE